MAIRTTGPASASGLTTRDIADHIRTRIIHEGLELDEIGIDLAEVTDDVPLFDDDGLNLDSIDALEVLAGVQREFGLSLPDVDQAFMAEHCSTVGRLARLVESMSVERTGRGPAAHAGARQAVAGGGLESRTPMAMAGNRPPSSGVEERPDESAADSRSLPDRGDA